MPDSTYAQELLAELPVYLVAELVGAVAAGFAYTRGQRRAHGHPHRSCAVAAAIQEGVRS